MAGWLILKGQQQIFTLLDSRHTGILLTESELMIPWKSSSIVLSLGRHVQRGS